jgi:hypothetical protein
LAALDGEVERRGGAPRDVVDAIVEAVCGANSIGERCGGSAGRDRFAGAIDEGQSEDADAVGDGEGALCLLGALVHADHGRMAAAGAELEVAGLVVGVLAAPADISPRPRRCRSG